MKFSKAVPSALIHAYDCYLSYLTNLKQLNPFSADTQNSSIKLCQPQNAYIRY